MTDFKSLCRLVLRWVAAPRMIRGPVALVGRAGLLPAAVWRRLPVEGTFTTRVPGGQAFHYVSCVNDAIGRALLWRGWRGHEPETCEVWYRLAQDAHLVLDIGANTGIFALLALAANHRCQVIAFEPVPAICGRLRENLRINGWEDRCEVRQEAVAEAVGVAQFHVPPSVLPVSASLNPHGFRSYAGELIEVRTTTTDAACALRDRVDLIKIDVEGFEDKVLQGMNRILAEWRPRLIVECLPDGPFQAVEETLCAHGYHFWHLRGDGPAATEHIVPDPQERWRNFLCLPEGDEPC